jgi:quinoprotein glucose dehydrogenase
VGGWSPPGKGRIFRVTDPEAMKNPAVEEAKKILAEGFEKKTTDELAKFLGHLHQQVRQEAQFELTSRKPEDAIKAFEDVLKNSKNRVARLHAVWGLGTVVRAKAEAIVPLVLLVKDNDKDDEVKRAALAQLGDVLNPSSRVRGVGADSGTREAIRRLMTDPNARVQATAAVTYGKIGDSLRPHFPGSEQSFYAPLFDLLKANNDKDPYVRHAAVMGLVHAAPNPLDLFNAWTLAKDKYDTPAVRMGVLLVLRKHRHEKVAVFLDDGEPRIVAEAARAIYDERIEGAREALAKVAEKTGQPDAVAYRALAANYTLGDAAAARRVATFAGRQAEADHTRAFALKLLGDWTKPPRRDPITGLTLDLPARDAKLAADALKAVGGAIFAGSDVVRREAAQVVAKLKLTEFGPAMAAIVKDETQPLSLRVEALYAVDALKDAATKDLVALALASTEPKLRAAGLTVKARLEPAAVMKELPALLKDEKASIEEKQAGFAALASQRRSEEADKLLDEWLDLALAKKVPPELVLDVLDAAETRANTPKLRLSAPLKSKVEKYRGEQAKQDDKLAPFLESLAGGDAEKGRNIFLNNSAVYCQRCHKLDNQGGDVGPVMNGIAAEKERDRRYLLESIALPSAKIAKGFETVILILEDERTISGIIKGEDKTNIKLVTAENKEVVVAVKDVAARRTGPSAMPDDLHKKMTRRELRDVVEFLASLKDPPNK